MFLKTKIKEFSITAGILFIGISGHCTPDMTAASWSGSLGAGTTITMTVTGAGATGPTMVIYESFENGVVGSSMTNGTAASYTGSWSTPTIAGFGPVYSTTEKFSGSKSMASDMTTNPPLNGGEFYNQIFLSSATQVLICTDWKLTGDWPGYCGSGSNMKFNWLMFGNLTTNTDLYQGFSASACNIPSGSVIDSNNLSQTPKFFSANISTTSDVGGSSSGWHQRCEYINGKAPGDVRFYEIGSTGTVRISYSTTSLALPFLDDPESLNGYWDRIHVPGFGRLTAGTVWYHDNIYVSTGTAAAAHVWIMDASTIFTSTKWALLKPVTWSDTSITAMIPTNSFSNGASAYIYICDSSFVCNTTGFLVTMGVTQGSSPGTSYQGLGLQGVIIR